MTLQPFVKGRQAFIQIDDLGYDLSVREGQPASLAVTN
jgi:hypothetical protein